MGYVRAVPLSRHGEFAGREERRHRRSGRGRGPTPQGYQPLTVPRSPAPQPYTPVPVTKAPPELPPLTEAELGASRWGRMSPPARLGRFLRLQAEEGARAATIELRPGLYLVAEVPEAAAAPGFAGDVLGSLLVATAAKALVPVAQALGPGAAPRPPKLTAETNQALQSLAVQALTNKIAPPPAQLPAPAAAPAAAPVEAEPGVWDEDDDFGRLRRWMPAPEMAGFGCDGRSCRCNGGY